MVGANMLAVPLAAKAQPQARVPRIGWLGGPSRETAQPFVQPFLQGLKDLGWVEGRTIAIEWGPGRLPRPHLPRGFENPAPGKTSRGVVETRTDTNS